MTGELRVFTPEVQRWETDILRWSQEFALPPNLVATVMQIESCGDVAAVSPVGAQGLFQVMPFHFEPGEDSLLPETNARRGLNYLRQSFLLANGAIDLALAGYNGGHGQITRSSSDWPAETQRYVNWGVAIYRDSMANLDSSPALSEWLRAGGSHLCLKAGIRRLALGDPEPLASLP
jgi:soluble lytic murein transglycosylase-like protein